MFTLSKFSEWQGLGKLSEEMGELQQVLGKLVENGGELLVKYDPKYCDNEADWIGLDLGDKLVEELGDVLAALNFFTVNNFSDDDMRYIIERADIKMAKYKEWSNDPSHN